MLPIVQPINTTITLTKMSIRITELILFESVSIMVSLYTDDEILYDNKYYKLTGDEYANWASDDHYIIQYVNLQLGLLV